MANAIETYSVVIYNSANYDSTLSKDIIVAQYKYAYSKDVNNLSNNIVVYDVASDESSNPDIDIYNLDRTEDKTDIDRIFICGLFIGRELLEKFINDNENIQIFDNNLFSINLLRSLINYYPNAKNNMDKNKSLSLKVVNVLIDPLGVFEDSDNTAYKLLCDYSNAISMTYKNAEEMHRCNTVRYAMENKLNIDKFVKVLLNRGETDESNIDENLLFDLSEGDETFNSIDELYNNYTEDQYVKIKKIINDHGILWTGDVLAINDRIDIPESVVQKIIGEDKEYSLLFVFAQDDIDYTTAYIYRAERPVYEPINASDPCTPETALPNTVYYLINGAPVLRKDYIVGKEITSLWFNTKLNKQINIYSKEILDLYKKDYISVEPEEIINNWVEDLYYYQNEYDGEYILVEDVELVKENDDFRYFKYDTIITLYLDKAQIDFNLFNLYDRCQSKFLCKGNKFKVEAYLTHKQIYDCMNTQALF